jgi:hypothetical protein
LIHDAPIDVALGIAVDGLTFDGLPLVDTLVVGTGREELLRVSTAGDDLAALAGGLQDPDPGTRAAVAGRLWSAVAANRSDIQQAAETFGRAVRGLAGIAGAMQSWQFDIHEGDGVVPLGREIGRLRQVMRAAGAPPAALRPVTRLTN